MEYKKNLSEPWFSLIKLKIKTCEGRLNKGDFMRMKQGDYIQFENNDFNFKRICLCKITSIHNYNSFEEYLKKEKLELCLPGINKIEEGLSIYYKYYNKEDEKLHKITAIRLSVLEGESLN